MLDVTGVTSVTASKALQWMNKEKIITYYAGRTATASTSFSIKFSKLLNNLTKQISHKAENANVENKGLIRHDQKRVAHRY